MPSERRPIGIALTVLAHAALLLAWQLALRPPPAAVEPAQRTIQWLRLPAPAALPAAPPMARVPPAAPAARTTPAAPARAAPRAMPQIVVPAAPVAMDAAPSPPAPAAPPPPASAPGVLQRALRDAGAVDRALRKERNPYIVAPLDSPQIRLRKGIEAAAELAPNKWYEAPKTAELVNNTGDGARRTRVISGGGSYCITERAPTTSIDMIEKHGKLRITSCPEHETPANAQEWRTARD